MRHIARWGDLRHMEGGCSSLGRMAMVVAVAFSMQVARRGVPNINLILGRGVDIPITKALRSQVDRQDRRRRKVMVCLRVSGNLNLGFSLLMIVRCVG